MTLAVRLLLLIGLALLPPLAVQAWNAVELSRAREAAVNAAAVAQAADITNDMDRVAGSVQQLLVALSEIPAIRSGDNGPCTAVLRAVAERSPHYDMLAANAPDGTVLCTSGGASSGAYSNAAQAFHQRALQAGRFVVGDLAVAEPSSRPSVHFALPFRRMDGEVGGVVLAGIETDHLAATLAGAALAPGAEAMLIDPSGTVVAAVRDNRPVQAAWVGRPAPAALRSALAVSRPTTFEATAPDGMRRLFGAVPADPALGGLVLTVAIDRGAAFADLRWANRRSLLGILAGAGLALAAGALGARRFILQPLARLTRTAERVGEGDLSARADLGRHAGAFRGVGRALDRMSDALAEREGQRAESEIRFRTMANSVPALMWMTRPDNHMVFANDHFTAVFGRPVSDMLGMGWVSVIVAEDLPAFGRATAAAAAGTPMSTEVRVIDRFGAIRWLRCDGRARFDGAGTLVGYTGCGVDVTEARQAAGLLEARVEERTAALSHALDRLGAEAAERQEAEAALRQAQKMEAVGQLTGGIAHDFNNMLQGISSGLELMQARIGQNRTADALRFGHSAQQAVERAAALTQRLLAFSRREALQPTPVAPAALVRGLAELMERALGPGIGFQLDVAEPGWAVLCDHSQIENALLNLAINARDAMPDGGRLHIETRNVVVPAFPPPEGGRPGEHVEIVVSDTGTGMDEETRRRAFEPFFTTKPLGQGTGLGLSQLYGFVQQSGGFLRLRSAPGEGTTIHIFLPRHHGAVAASAPAPAAPSPLPALEVLLVEDEPMLRDAIATHLCDHGHRVHQAANGVAALAMLERVARPCVLVSDIGLTGGMNGRSLAEAVRQRWPGMPVLFVTGYSWNALDTPFPPPVALLTKPFTLSALEAKLGELLRRDGSAPPLPQAWPTPRP